MTIKNLKFLALFLIGATAFAATGKLQNADFATGAQLVSAGGTVSQLLNTSKVYDSANSQLLDTTIASKITGPLTGEVTTVGSVATVSNSAVIAKVLTGYVSGGSLPILATDSILTSLQKLGANIANGISLGLFGSTPNTSGASLNAGQITLQPADATNPGGISTAAQTIPGAKTFAADTTIGANIIFTPVVNNSLSGANARVPSHTTANIVFTNASLTSIGSANNGGVVGGHSLQITNETGGNLTLVNNYASAAAGEAIFTGTTADVTIPNHGTFWLQYDATASAWTSVGSRLVNLASTQVTGLLPNANLANPSTTVNGTTCTLGGTCTISATGSPLSIGTIDSQSRSADGLVTASNVLYAQTATAAFPGLVSASTQTFGGNKTFNGTVNLNTVTASRFLFGSSAKNVTSSLVNLADTTNHVTGITGVANGGTGISTTPTNGQIPIGDGTKYVAANITAGTNITIVNSAGGITVSASSVSGSGTIGAWTSCTGNTLTGFGTGTPPTFTYCKYRQIGSDSIEMEGLITNGDPNGVEARMALPSGLTTASDYPTLQICGYGWTSAGDQTFLPLCEASKTYITFGKGNSATAGLSKALGTAWASVGTLLSFRGVFRVTGLP